VKKVERIKKVRDPKVGVDWGDMRTIVRIFSSKEEKRLAKRTRMTNRYHQEKLYRFYCVRVQIPNT
jgi:hypothetical protein